MEEVKKKVVAFLATQPLGVISTVNENGTPESAVVGVSENPELELIFGTSNESRKYANLKKNPHVSFVIGWKDKTIQYEGVARELEGEEVSLAQDAHVAKIPTSAKYVSLPTQRYFKIKPKWLKFTDFGPDSESVEEVRF